MKPFADFKGHSVEQLFLEVQMGQVEDAFIMWKFGQNKNVGTTPSDIWSHGGEYPNITTASVLGVVSNASDTVEIRLEGLDTDYNIIEEIVVLNGTTEVFTTAQFLRIYRACNFNDTPLVGTVTIKHGTTVVSEVLAEANQTLQAVYTIPAGYTAYLFKGMASAGKLKDAQISFKVRPFGRGFCLSETSGLYQSTYEATRPFLKITEKSDIKVSAVSSSANTDVSAQFGLLLLKNSTWSE